MRALIIAFVAVLAVPAFAQTVYTWEDKDGTHYTDDINQVPKGKKVASERLAAPRPMEESPLPVATPTNQATPAPVPEVLSENGWRDRFVGAHRRISTLRQSIVALEASIPPRVDCVINTRITPGTTAAGAAVQQQRCAVNVQHDRMKAEVAQQKIVLRDAELDLEQLERDATRMQVPREWRRGW